MAYKVKSVSVLKTGSGDKGPWTLYELELEGYDKRVKGFHKVEVGDMVDVTVKENGQYTNYNYTKAKSTGGSTSAGGGASDPRALKLLTVVAEQVGVDKQVILDILDGKE